MTTSWINLTWMWVVIHKLLCPHWATLFLWGQKLMFSLYEQVQQLGPPGLSPPPHLPFPYLLADPFPLPLPQLPLGTPSRLWPRVAAAERRSEDGNTGFARTVASGQGSELELRWGTAPSAAAAVLQLRGGSSSAEVWVRFQVSTGRSISCWSSIHCSDCCCSLPSLHWDQLVVSYKWYPSVDRHCNYAGFGLA